MKEIIYNNEMINDNDIDELEVRVKALIINLKQEILLGYSYNTYQFPGGHLKKGETLEEALLRELKEETGIDFSDFLLDPFMKITYYLKNYKNRNINRKSVIYYYEIHTEKQEDINNLSLDKREEIGNFTLHHVPLSEVEKLLIDSIPDNEINKIIVNEMLEILDEYKKRRS